MKQTDSKQQEKNKWINATAGAILAGSVANALVHNNKRAKQRIQTFLSTRKWFVCTVVFLITCVLLTTFLLIGQLDRFLYRKKHDLQIDLLANPSVAMNDKNGNQAFSSLSTDSLFQASYTGADGETLTVVSANGDDVVAPGTSGEYVFQLKNTGKNPVIYSVKLDGFLSIESTNHLLPIHVRMKGQEGDYLIGSDTEWAPIAQLTNISDAGTLKEKSSRYYTLEWLWPYENGNDTVDTMLGIGAVEIENGTIVPQETVDFTLQIETLAMLPVDDRAPITLFFDRAFPILLAVSLTLSIGALVAVAKYRRRDEEFKQQ